MKAGFGAVAAKHSNKPLTRQFLHSEKQRFYMINSADFDFRHHLYDTLILLGCKKQIADLLIASQDFVITEGDVDQLRKYNATLIDQTKDRLMNINSIKIQRQPNPSP
jgi:hypothetical protein